MEVTNGMKYTLAQITGYLAQKGIPKSMVTQIRQHLTYDSVAESHAVIADRIFAGIAIAARKAFGFGPKRIMQLLKEFDAVAGSVLDGPDGKRSNKDWTDLMEWLREETGLIIRSGDGDRLVVEVLTDEEKQKYKYSDRYVNGEPKNS